MHLVCQIRVNAISPGVQFWERKFSPQVPLRPFRSCYFEEVFLSGTSGCAFPLSFPSSNLDRCRCPIRFVFCADCAERITTLWQRERKKKEVRSNKDWRREGETRERERGPITTSIAAKNRNLRSSVGIRGVTLWTVVVENEKEKAPSKGIALIRSDGPGPCSAQMLDLVWPAGQPRRPDLIAGEIWVEWALPLRLNESWAAIALQSHKLLQTDPPVAWPVSGLLI